MTDRAKAAPLSERELDRLFVQTARAAPPAVDSRFRATLLADATELRTRRAAPRVRSHARPRAERWWVAALAWPAGAGAAMVAGLRIGAEAAAGGYLDGGALVSWNTAALIGDAVPVLGRYLGGY